jgi:hypothetical protein
MLTTVLNFFYIRNFKQKHQYNSPNIRYHSVPVTYVTSSSLLTPTLNNKYLIHIFTICITDTNQFRRLYTLRI